MNYRFFSHNITPHCNGCDHGRMSANNKILCRKKGIIKESFTCKDYKYNPLKRIPSPISSKIPDFTYLSKKDFEL